MRPIGQRPHQGPVSIEPVLSSGLKHAPASPSSGEKILERSRRTRASSATICWNSTTCAASVSGVVQVRMTGWPLYAASCPGCLTRERHDRPHNLLPRGRR